MMKKLSIRFLIFMCLQIILFGGYWIIAPYFFHSNRMTVPSKTYTGNLPIDKRDEAYSYAFSLSSFNEALNKYVTSSKSFKFWTVEIEKVDSLWKVSAVNEHKSSKDGFEILFNGQGKIVLQPTYKTFK